MSDLTEGISIEQQNRRIALEYAVRTSNKFISNAAIVNVKETANSDVIIQDAEKFYNFLQGATEQI